MFICTGNILFIGYRKQRLASLCLYTLEHLSVVALASESPQLSQENKKNITKLNTTYWYLVQADPDNSHSFIVYSCVVKCANCGQGVTVCSNCLYICMFIYKYSRMTTLIITHK